MTAAGLAAAALLFVAVACVLVASLGVLLARDPYTRLHYMAPAATLGTWSVAAAVVATEFVNQGGIKALLTATVIFFMNAVLSHATARVQQYGSLDILPGEKPRRAGEADH